MRLMRSIRRRLTYANVVATLALVVALTAGTAYAANAFTGADIVNGSLTGVDIAGGSIGSGLLRDGGVRSADLHGGAVDRAALADGAVDGDVVSDGTLTNADTSVFFADVTFEGDVVASSGGVEVAHPAAGVYDVSFGRDVTQCGWSATPASRNPATPDLKYIATAVSPVAGAIRVSTSAGVSAASGDAGFNLVVAC